MTFLRRFSLALVVLLASAVMSFAELPKLKAAVLKIGTVNWELEVIKHHKLDEKHGFALDVVGMAGNPATRIAFQGSEADIVVADWIWVARQRAEGKDFVFIPYSKAVGGLMVKADSNVKSLADLAGAKIGIAGGPVDKSWLLIQALAQKELDLSLQNKTEQIFGAPPLIFKAALQGEVDGAINFWHFGAKMEAAGMRPLVSVAEAAEKLGLSPDTPLLGYVVKGEMVKTRPDLVAAFAAASRDAKAILAKDDAEWARLRPLMRAEKDADFQALIAGFRAGIPSSQTINEDEAAAVLKVMAEYGGEKLVGQATTLPEGVFYKP